MESYKQRLSWKEYALRLAQTASLRSEDPFEKVGACALDYSNRVIAVAYNGLAPGVNADREFWLDRDRRRPYIVHAEANALSLIKRGECCILACTLLPCSCCATMISAYGIKCVVYKDIYKRDTKALDIFKFNNICCEQLSPIE